jgi:hypothetical protein
MNTSDKPARREDPLIDEVRAIREELSRRFNNDVHALAEYLKKYEHDHPAGIATPRPDQNLPAAG